jgi:hypothetical protein
MLRFDWPLGSAVSDGDVGFLVTPMPLSWHCLGVASFFRVANKMG